MTARAGTPTPSLRRRAVVTVLGLFALLLVLTSVVVDLAVGAQLRRDLDARLADRVAAAGRLAGSGTTDPELVPLLQGQDIRVRVVAPDGTACGDPGLGSPGPPAPDRPPAPPVPPAPPAAPVPSVPSAPPAAPVPSVPSAAPVPSGTGPKGAPAPPPAPPTPPDRTSTVVLRTLPDGSRLVLVADTTAITQVRSLLRVVMVGASIAALVAAALALVGGVAAALRPLDRMTAVARRITAGDRGARLAPDRPGRELGRAAAAFDDALDALEDAEARARRAADDLRGFLADAAHELRTPPAGVQALAEATLLAPADAERAQRRARLGLPRARALARAHGGDLVAEPAARGARFRLTLPVDGG